MDVHRVGEGGDPAELYRLLDEIPLLVARVDANRVHRYCNARYLAWFGGAGTEVVGRRVEEVMGHEAYACLGPELREGLAGRRRAAELQLVDGSGRRRRFLADYVPCEVTGSAGGCYLLLQDVSQFREHEWELDDANRRKDEFLAILGHELRNPLGAISSAVAVLGLLGHRSEMERETISILQQQVRQVRRLLDDLLDLSRASHGSLHVDLRPIDVLEVVRSALGGMRSSYEERGIRLVMDSDLEEAKVLGDAGRLEQVFVNLLSNACKFSSRGGTVTVHASAEGDEVRVEVQDTGAGITPSELPNIFDPFSQGGSRVEGLGIGLTLVQRLVALHGGTVSAESPGRGGGSVFTVTLARAPAG